jgi:hypothetical protein
VVNRKSKVAMPDGRQVSCLALVSRISRSKGKMHEPFLVDFSGHAMREVRLDLDSHAWLRGCFDRR